MLTVVLTAIGVCSWPVVVTRLPGGTICVICEELLSAIWCMVRFDAVAEFVGFVDDVVTVVMKRGMTDGWPTVIGVAFIGAVLTTSLGGGCCWIPV
jgi:hypothetical protein